MRTALPAAVLAALAFAGPAAAQDPVTVYETAPRFFSCPGPAPLLTGGDPWGLTETAPAASFTTGAGCGFLDTTIAGAAPGNTTYDAVAEGSFSGPVKSLNVELHDLLLSQAESTTLGGVSFTVQLEIDGEPVIDTTEQDPPVEAIPTVSSTGASQSVKFSLDLTKLGLTADVERSYRLTFGTYYSDTAKAWVAGATEIPSGITFNPAKLSKPTVKPE